MEGNKIETHQTDELESVLVCLAHITLPHNVLDVVFAKAFFLCGWSGTVIYDAGAKVRAIEVGEISAVAGGSSHRIAEETECKFSGKMCDDRWGQSHLQTAKSLRTSGRMHASITLHNHIWKRRNSRADAQHGLPPIGILSALSLPYLVPDPMGFLALTSISCRFNAHHGRYPTVPPPAIYESGCDSPIHR